MRETFPRGVWVGPAKKEDASTEPAGGLSRDRARSASPGSGNRSADSRDVAEWLVPRTIHNAVDRLEVAFATLDMVNRNQAQFMSRTHNKIVEVNVQANVVNAIDARSKQTELHFGQAWADIIDR